MMACSWVVVGLHSQTPCKACKDYGMSASPCGSRSASDAWNGVERRLHNYPGSRHSLVDKRMAIVEGRGL
jgi:hypothetical protein